MFHEIHKIVFLFLVCLNISCGSRVNNGFNGFPEKYNIAGEPISEIATYSKGNVKLAVVDTFLVLQKAEEKYLQIFGTNSLRLLAEIGTMGRGPGEFLFPELLRQSFIDRSAVSPIIEIYDYERRRVTSIDILKNLNNQHVINKQEIIPDIDAYINYFFFNTDSMFLCSPNIGGRFMIYDYKSSEIYLIPYLPKLDYRVKDEYLPLIFRSTCWMNVEKRLIVAAPIFLGQIDFFDLKGKYLRSTVFESNDAFKKLVTGNNKSFVPKNYIVDVISNGELIYGLNFNNTDQEIYHSKELTNQEILVFNWEGLPIREYVLDERFISSFAIDFRHNRIFGYCPNELDHPVIAYNLDGIPL